MKKIAFTLISCLIIGLIIIACKPDPSYPSPLEGITIQDVTLEADEKEKTIEVSSRLDDVKAKVTDPITNDPIFWLNVEVTKSTVKLKLEENFSTEDRKAKVELYNDGGRTDLEGATTTQFVVTQKKHSLLEGLNLQQVIEMIHLKGDTIIDTGNTLKNIKAVVTDIEGQTANWCTARVSGESVIVNLAENKNNSIRQAVISLRPSTPQTNTPDSLIAHKDFLITQLKNPVLDSVTIADQSFTYEGGKKGLKFKRQLTGIKAKFEDSETLQKVNWLSAAIAGDSVTLNVSKLSTKKDRETIVTIYLPNNGETIDSTTISVSFKLKQLHNSGIDDYNFKGCYFINYKKTTDTIKVGGDLSAFKTLIKESQSWLTTEIKGGDIILRMSANMSKNDRAATVTIYQPTNGTNIDSTTISREFVVKQLHNSATDSLVIKDHTIGYNQRNDTLHIKEYLNGFKGLLLDPTTGMAPKWLNVTVKDHEIIFKAEINNEMTSRNAKVTIYQPNNGSIIDENTIQHNFVLTQQEKKILEPEVNKIETDYTNHTVDVIITSNVKYQIETDGSTWISRTTMTPIDNTHEKLSIALTENATMEDRKATITLRSGNDLSAKIDITQKTNPTITLLDGATTRKTFDKGQSEFTLNIKTLTPNYTISKKANWISVGSKQTTSSTSEFQHRVTISAFTGDGPERVDTIIVKNFAQEKRLIIMQHNYVIMEQTAAEVEVGRQIQLKCKNMSSIPTLSWSSDNNNIATVNSEGIVTGVKSGTTTIRASIGNYLEVLDYNDYCKVTVYTPVDKMKVERGQGPYTRDGDRVISECPVIITNNYNGPMTIKSVMITGKTIEGYQENDYSQESKELSDVSSITINRDKSHTFTFNPLINVYNPKVVVKMVANGEEYTKTVNY